jgi:hypothetical protein
MFTCAPHRRRNLCATPREEGLQMSEQPSLTKDPQEPDHTGTFDDLLAEVAMSYPLAGYAAAVETDEELVFDHQILAGLVLP